MATPVKNLTDPTGLTRLGAEFIHATPKAPSLDAARFAGTDIAVIFGIPVVKTQTNIEVNDTVKAKIPPPPMGKLVLLTFPPIYRERKGAIYGQVYPPKAP